MKTPTGVLSHCLAHRPVITPDTLRNDLKKDQALGYAGTVIVPALIDRTLYTPEQIVEPFIETGMQGLVCGFNAGNGPDPFSEHDGLVLDSLKSQGLFAVKFAEKGVSPPLMVGPTHTWHGQKRAIWSEDKFRRWIDSVEKLFEELGLDAAFEGLNDTEDATPDTFDTLYYAVRDRKRLGIQFDTGHAHLRKVLTARFCEMAHKIRYFEFANVGRSPLSTPRGINFENYAAAMGDLPDNCIIGDEPFCQAVINAFGLKGLCDTLVEGEEALSLDAVYLQNLGVMARTA